VTRIAGCTVSVNITHGIRESLQSLVRNWVMSIAAVSTVTISLIILGSFIILAMSIGSLVSQYEEDVEIKVFFELEAEPGAMSEYQREVRALETVSTVTFISKDEALLRLEEQLNDPRITENLGTNPLPASIEVRLVDSREVQAVADEITSMDDKEIVNSVKFGGEVTEKLLAVLDVVRTVGIGFLVLLGLASLVIVSNTIRLAIFARRREIGIMKLVGASNWFIRWPFLLEGFIEGIVGAIVALLLLQALDAFFIQSLLDNIAFLPFDTSLIRLDRMAIYLVATGAIVGLLGSALAIRRYLKA